MKSRFRRLESKRRFWFALSSPILVSRFEIDDAFFNRTGLERVEVVGLDLDCCWASPLALDVALLCKKNKKEERPTRAPPVAAPRWPYIYSIRFPSWMVIRIPSHWTRYFLPLLVSDLIKDIERAVYLELSLPLIGGILLDRRDELLYPELSYFLSW